MLSFIKDAREAGVVINPKYLEATHLFADDTEPPITIE